MTFDPSASSTAPGPASRHPWAIATAVALVLTIAVLDQLTKTYAESVLERGEFVPLIGDSVGWQLVYNPGGAFGLPLPSWVFLVVTVLVVVLVARALPRTPLLTAAVAYGLLLGGAIGNVIDRLVRSGDPGFGGGHVVDFVAWGSFPRFNVADSAITVGFLLLVVAMLIDERQNDAEQGGGAAEHGRGAAEQRGGAAEQGGGAAEQGGGAGKDGDGAAHPSDADANGEAAS